MNLKKSLALIILFILILPSISLNALSQAEENDNNSPKTIIDKLLELRFKIGTAIAGISRWKVMQLKPPTPIQAYPETVNLKYLNETTIIIGGKNPDALDEWNTLINISGGWDWGWMDQSISYTFEFVPPEDAPKDVWIANFDPPRITASPNKKNMDWPGANTPFKTNLTLTLNPSADPYYPTQDVNIKVNVIKEEVSPGRLTYLFPPAYPLTHTEEYLQKTEGRRRYFYPTSKYLIWLVTGPSLIIMNLQNPAYDRRIENVVSILVKVEKDHQAQIIAPPPMEIQPYQVLSIPVTIRNLGSHTDTFNFRINTTDKDMFVSPPPAITLNPGEEGQALIGVAAPKIFRSVGSVSSINLEAYSIEEPEKVFRNTIILSMEGIHVSGENIYYGVLILLILVIIATFILFFLRKRRAKICEKPEKPWKIPEEKEYLEKLKEKNKEEYKKVLEMMKEEYESSLLWYASYVKAMMEKERQEKQKAKVAEKEKKVTEKPKTKKIEAKKSIETREEEIEKTLEKPAAKIEFESAEERKKQEAILKIKREQEKQKKKFKP